MPLCHLTADEVLTTTRSVRKRLDFTRPVEREVSKSVCGSRSKRRAAATGRDGTSSLSPMRRNAARLRTSTAELGALPQRCAARPYDDPNRAATQGRVRDSAQYLADHFHEAPVHRHPLHHGPDGRLARERAERRRSARSSRRRGASCSRRAPVASAPAGRRSISRTSGKRRRCSAFRMTQSCRSRSSPSRTRKAPISNPPRANRSQRWSIGKLVGTDRLNPRGAEGREG